MSTVQESRTAPTQVFRAHGCGGLRALLGTHRPLQNPLPIFPSCVIVPVSFLLSPLCSPFITVSAFVPLRPCPFLFSKVSHFPHLPLLDGVRSQNPWGKSRASLREFLEKRFGQHLSHSPSLCFKTSITIAILYSGAFPFISLLHPQGSRDPSGFSFRGSKTGTPGAWEDLGSYLCHARFKAELSGHSTGLYAHH